jgi:DNA-directed RNA polymerase subunit D
MQEERRQKRKKSMKIENISKNKKSGMVAITFKNTNPAIINTIRRATIDLVPTMAIKQVTFIQNGSALYDEIIAHRLGLVVLNTDLKGYFRPEECSCQGEGCAKCQAILTLKANGPCTVYAGDMKCKDPKIKPEHPKTIIVKLLKDQTLEFQATAVLGTGKTHTKHSPGLTWHTFKETAIINNNHKSFDEFKEKYPKEAFNKEGKIDEKLIEQKNLYDACDGVNDNIVKIEYDPSIITLKIEPWGQLSVQKILITAIEEIKKKFENFEEKIK